MIFLHPDLRNTDSPDIGELGESNRDKPATFCNGDCAKNCFTSRGVLVVVGSYAKKCPRCESTNLLHDSVTPKRALSFAKEKRSPNGNK